MPVSSLAEKPRKYLTEKPQKYRLLKGSHDEPLLDDKGNRVCDEQGTPQTLRYRQGEIIETRTDLCKKFNGAHPSMIKFRRVTEHEQEEWDEMQAAMNPTGNAPIDGWDSMNEKELRHLAEENKLVIPANVKGQKAIADFVRKAMT